MLLRRVEVLLVLFVTIIIIYPDISRGDDEQEEQMCGELLPPINGELHCGIPKKKPNLYVCKAECDPGYEFPEGKKQKRVCNLKKRKWNSEREFPACVPICDPPCVNGGECVEGNICVCIPSYRGNRCQFPKSICDPSEKFPEVKDWKCNHTSLETLCVFKCSENTQYEFQPADLYHCSVEGLWEPDLFPKCISNSILESVPSDICASWNQFHYRTFDGRMYNFHGPCQYLLAKDCVDNTFSIHVKNSKGCANNVRCQTFVILYVGDDVYNLISDEIGPGVEVNGQVHRLPTVLNGIMFKLLSDYVTVSSPIGFRLKWNQKSLILLKVNKNLQNKTCGLCGKFDGMSSNDFEMSNNAIADNIETFVSSWVMEDIAEYCAESTIVKDTCTKQSIEKVSEATKECQVLFESKFSACHLVLNPEPYFEDCKMDYCACDEPEKSCICNTVSEYFRECFRLGGKIDGGWRSSKLCPLSCPSGMVYEDCGTSCPKTCKRTVYDCEENQCIDGCHCPQGTVLHNDQCIPKQQCPCIYKGKEYEKGEQITEDCNACECLNGRWECTKEKCGAQCSSIGDPHYTTFDGLKYEFLGTCPYYLFYHDDFAVIQENGPCFTASAATAENFPQSCTKAVKINYFDSHLFLMPNNQVLFNDREITDLPFSENGVNVDMPSSLFIKVELANNVSVMWDGKNRIYIDVSPSWFGKTKGLCGTFNHNQNDDFLTPDGDTEADIPKFAERWQASESCHKRTRRRADTDPCEMQPQKAKEAEEYCLLLKSSIFKSCHDEIDPESFYRNCMFDLCACVQDLQFCICPILAHYSLLCANKGIIMDWTDEITPCKPLCEGGEIYQECGNSCKRSCSSIATSQNCKEKCVQGCVCPPGMALDAEGYCITVEKCPCIYNEKEYLAGSITIQGSNICECDSAIWKCRSAQLDEIIKFKSNIMQQDNPLLCSLTNNEEFTSCVEDCPSTCQNMHLRQNCKTKTCKSGCRCKDGFILDTELEKCVKISECGCIHGGQRHKEGSVIQKDCNLCTCIQGTWKCTEETCPGICTVWGESHFKTYDGLIYDFHGDCEYVLSKGKLSKNMSFALSLQNIPCGTSGVTCSKSFTLSLDKKKVLTLSKDEPIAQPETTFNSRFIILESNMRVSVYTDIGVSLQWDKGTTLYVTLDPHWQNKVKGLCGNFNNEQTDDFQTPFGGLPESRLVLFADSWRVEESCPASKLISDICEVHPERKAWAYQKCGILKSLFKSCHSEVRLEPYYERCVFDACACDSGGDCDCLCTAVAAYAQECNIHGVHIKWRSQDFCPIQCEECAIYDNCMPSCPKKTCESELIYERISSTCSLSPCIEGCNPKPCPVGQIYNNEKEYKCIPEHECVIPCLEVNGRLYNEGERISDPTVTDSCQSCHCLRGSVVCTGKPCPTTTEPTAGIAPECKETGWTPWINTNKHENSNGDYELLNNPLLNSRISSYCSIQNVTAIECRVADSKILYKEAGQNVLCNLPTGFICEDDKQNSGICDDYEIRVYCFCGFIETTSVSTTTEAIEYACLNSGWTAWMSGHAPDSTGELETFNILRKSHVFCSDEEITDVECRSTTSWENPITSGNPNVICSTKNGLICTNTDHFQCEDYEIRFYCKCKGVETIPPSVCTSGWTEFFNVDNPLLNPDGDEETIDKIREHHSLCPKDMITDIECKALIKGDMTNYIDANQFGLKCSKEVGFICYNLMQINGERCHDYIVRFYCSCEEVPESTSPVHTTQTVPSSTPVHTTQTVPSPTPVHTTQTVSSPTPVSKECGWTPWLNTDQPRKSVSDIGDIEDIEHLRTLYDICGPEHIKDIECRMAKTLHSYDLSLQTNLTCDTKVGFLCYNRDQIGDCYDYEVRVLCMYDWCFSESVTEEILATTISICPAGQVYDSCAYRCDQTCSSFLYKLSLLHKCNVSSETDECIEGCRPVDGCSSPHLWRDYYTCVPKSECTCIIPKKNGQLITLAPNALTTNECEVCQCVNNDISCHEKPGCKAQITIPSLLDIMKNDCETKWINIDSPLSGSGDFESLVEIRNKYDFCLDPIKIECQVANSFAKAIETGQKLICDLKSGLICWNTDNSPEGCKDYEIRFFCPCATSTTTTTTTMTTTTTTVATTVRIPATPAAPSPCINGWTEWFNSHVIDENGDYETVQSVRTHGGYFCSNDMITAIQCREKGVSENVPLQSGVLCDLQTGLQCSNSKLHLESCRDYEVRFYCDCPTEAPTSVAPIFTETVKTTPLTTALPCAYWSEWINDHHPSVSSIKGIKGGTKKGVKNVNSVGDVERKMLLILQHKEKFCIKGYLSAIECRDAETDVDYTETGDINLSCSLASGFRCQGKDQPRGICRDYKIRYFCQCEHPTTAVTVRPPEPTTSFPPCHDFYEIIDGPHPLPDSSLKASSARDVISGPQNSRLSSKESSKSAGAWIASVTTIDQFLEIDLGHIQPVFGIITLGREGYDEYVKSYHILYSRDGETYSYIVEEPSSKTKKIFTGNFDDKTPVEHIFEQPFEARYVRIQPLTFSKAISLRIDLLGCAHGITTIVPQATQTPVCDDEMGIGNGNITDKQISVSSTRNENATISSIRINTQQVNEHPGGWVADKLDTNQYVQVYFFKPAVLTGVIIQGRDLVPQWVTAFTVSFSQDSVIWNDVIDYKGNVKVFAGNFDNDTPRKVFFPQAIRTQYIRIKPIKWNNWISMRLELIGCFEPLFTTTTRLPESVKPAYKTYPTMTETPQPVTTAKITIPESVKPMDHTYPTITETQQPVTEYCVQYGPWLSLSDSTQSFGDEEPIEKIISASKLCSNPIAIECREIITHNNYTTTKQKVICNLEHGLICRNDEQSPDFCYNYEVRIGCYNCETSSPTVTTHIPLSVCPEVPDIVEKNCPLYCARNFSCDGSSCIPHVDCPCFQEGRRFNPSDIFITSDCQQCSCILGGYSNCKPIVCPPCEIGVKSELTKDCKCECNECAEGFVLCPTNQQCIEAKLWCDGIKDCPDDEINCPTTPAIYVKTVATVPVIPSICTTAISSETKSCEVIADTFYTFDKLKYKYEICDHILMKEKVSELYSVTVHKTCPESNLCLRYVLIYVDDAEIKLGPGSEDVMLNGYPILIENLYLLSKNNLDFEIKKLGNHLIFQSFKYHFDVTWNLRQEIKIIISKCSYDKVIGLCGYLNDRPEDDRMKPDGSQALSSKDFGDSWSVGDMSRCIPSICSAEIANQSIAICEQLEQLPFSDCSDVLDINNYIDNCISYMCECLQQTTTVEAFDHCKCESYESFIEHCEELKGNLGGEWRIKYGCTPECPPGLEWNECGPGCDLTCDNYHDRNEICQDTCVPGCYCPPGLIHYHNKCVKPKLCHDCICRGHGDPNYITFDGHYYAFQGNCTYILAQHQSSGNNLDFQVLGTNVECPEEPHTSCTAGLEILWNGHKIEKFRKQPVYIDGKALESTMLSYEQHGITITFIPNKSTVIYIKEINLAVRYFDQIYGFNVELPSYLYFNKTEGLCGICNFNKSDDMYHHQGYITTDVEDFAYSWLVNNSKSNCIIPRVKRPNPEPVLCNFTESPCELFIDPTMYSKACLNDIIYSHNPTASVCRSKFQYAEQCCERGINLDRWLAESGCSDMCPENMLYKCTSACQKTCDNYKNSEVDNCNVMPLYTCTCPSGQVMKSGHCVDSILCEICDSEGHVIGDIWTISPCEKCECKSNQSIVCTITECPEPPICYSNETLAVTPPGPETCCSSYQCKFIEPVECPSLPMPDCERGMSTVMYIENDCPFYKCECKKELCPPLVKPITLELGMQVTVKNITCCDEYVIKCMPESCPVPEPCPLGFKVTEYEGECCKTYSCIPENVCVYTHKYEIVNGTEFKLPEDQYHSSKYEIGSSWHDGLCRSCSCEEPHSFRCTVEKCSDLTLIKTEADIYIWDSKHMPGACCPEYRRVQCLDNKKIYSIGESWPSLHDKCVTFSCITNENGEAVRETRKIVCDRTCPRYAKYQEPEPDSPHCCGYCKPFACEENDILYEPGSTWQSKSKNCFTAECSIIGNVSRIEYKMSCPAVPENCPKEHTVYDEEGCCLRCEIPTENCKQEQLPLLETVGFFHLQHEIHGKCSNMQPITNLTICVGQCKSKTFYQAFQKSFISSCKCCLPKTLIHRNIDLHCKDGNVIRKSYEQPLSCECSSCKEDSIPLEMPPPY